MRFAWPIVCLVRACIEPRVVILMGLEGYRKGVAEPCMRLSPRV